MGILNSIDMYRKDKITDIEKVEAEGVVEWTNSPFYIFASPKSDVNRILRVNAKLLNSSKEKDVPVVPNEWNPTVFRSASITPEILKDFDIWIGVEG